MKVPIILDLTIILILGCNLFGMYVVLAIYIKRFAVCNEPHLKKIHWKQQWQCTCMWHSAPFYYKYSIKTNKTPTIDEIRRLNMCSKFSLRCIWVAFEKSFSRTNFLFIMRMKWYCNWMCYVDSSWLSGSRL